MILHQLTGKPTLHSDTADLDPLTYLLESGSDRIGALDFQPSAEVYVPRTSGADLDQMVGAADRLEAGVAFSPELDAALLHGSTIGGARPKVLLNDGNRRLIAKLSSRSDPHPVVKAEAVGMELARRVGLNVPAVDVTTCLGHDVLLGERFDRTSVPGQRRMIVSALTILGLNEMEARYATYPDLATVIRQRFTAPRDTLRELFSRIVFNVCIGNVDDHARNHAAFWDGESLTLTPAYDLCPQIRSGRQASQAMAIDPSGFRASQLHGCVAAAPTYLLTRSEAQQIVDHQVAEIRSQGDSAAGTAELTSAQREYLWGRQILNPYIFEDAG